MSIQAEQTESDVSKPNRTNYSRIGGISSAALYFACIFVLGIVLSFDKVGIQQIFEYLALILLVGFPMGLLGGKVGGGIGKSKIAAIIGGIIFGLIPPAAVVIFLELLFSGG